MAALEFRLAETLGGTAKPGIESEEGTAFESLPRRKPYRNTADGGNAPVACTIMAVTGDCTNFILDQLK
jgi:hypothetical protein